MRISLSAAVLLAIAAFGAAVPSAQERRIGAAAIVANTVNGTLGSSSRNLKPGDGVFQNEIIATGAESRAQLLFTDETALNMGPDSRVVLDKVVYDPDRKVGDVSLRAVSGAFRFVSGSANKDAYSIKTPAGTIGIRGTIIEFIIVGNVVTLTLYEGATTFCISPSQCTTLDKPGTYVVVTGNEFTATQVLNALGCGGRTCNDTSYKQGDQTTYIAYYTEKGPGPAPPAGVGENEFQIALRKYLQKQLAKITKLIEHKDPNTYKLAKITKTIGKLNDKVEMLIPGLDTKYELWKAKWVVNQYTGKIYDILGKGHRWHHHHWGHHHFNHFWKKHSFNHHWAKHHFRKKWFRHKHKHHSGGHS
jgi:hypothetical protein